jgi:acetate kinase
VTKSEAAPLNIGRLVETKIKRIAVSSSLHPNLSLVCYDYRLAQTLLSLTAALTSIDAPIFTGGI